LLGELRAAEMDGWVNRFLQQYRLNTAEGKALLSLAEAFLRVPDSETADLLIRDKLGDEQADQISLDHLQGAYIGMAGKYQDEGASSKKEVVAIESLDELNEEPEGAPAAEGNQAIIEGIRDHLINGGSFSTIVEARKFIEGITGNKIEPGTQQAKEADEMIEAGVVMSARQIIADGREDGLQARTIYEQLVDLYDRQPGLNMRSSTSVANQAYSTPAPLAFVASELAGINSKTSVYEPTGGNGMLLIGANPQLVTANELNEDRFNTLKRLYPEAAVTQGDALQVSTKGKSFKVVIENPPFGKVGDISNIDHEIAEHSLRMLDDDGRAVLILGGVQATTDEGRRDGYRGKAKREFYFELYDKYNVVDHFTVGGNMYSKQGTTYPVDVIVIDGIGKSKRDLPAADLPQLFTSYEQLKEKLNDRLVSGEDRGTSGTDSGVGEAGRGKSGAVDSGTVGQGVESGTEGRGPTGSSEPGVSTSEPAAGGESKPAGGRTGTVQPGSADESKRGGQQPVSGDSVTKTGSKAGAEGRGPANLGGVSVVAGERVGSGLADRAGQEQETAGQVAYVPHSQANAVGTLVPRAMADAIDGLTKLLTGLAGLAVAAKVILPDRGK
jgi:predicted RNA methylase